MENEEDEELRRIKLNKLREMTRRKPQQEGVSPTDRPLDVTDATFPEFVMNHRLVVVDLWAPWCTPCHMIAPLLEQMAREFAGRILFGRINVDRNRRIVMKYQVTSIPTLLVFKDGRLVDRIVGAMPRQMLEPRIVRHL